jgi:arylsulfatase A-like enzyme
LADDLGYGDLGSFGSTTIKTPHLDRLAQEGMRLTDFYVPSAVCTPSRAALLTGRYPYRSGMTKVIKPESTDGLPTREETLAEVLKKAGYRTSMVGKWHLGNQEKHRPTRHGFGSWLGVLYSNNMTPFSLFEGNRVIEESVNQNRLTRRYTEFAVDFIKGTASAPFFLYFAHTSPHVPVRSSSKFRGKSAGGRYGDAVEEIDWSVGEILAALEETGQADNTLVFFTSDNGPWRRKQYSHGTSKPFRGGKSSVLEGGVRVPTLAWWPGHIAPASNLNLPAMTVDLLPTFVEFAGGALPKRLVLDGQSIAAPLLGEAAGDLSSRHLLFFEEGNLAAVRSGRWKLHVSGSKLKLYDLESDPAEKNNLIKVRPEIARELRRGARRSVSNRSR